MLRSVWTRHASMNERSQLPPTDRPSRARSVRRWLAPLLAVSLIAFLVYVAARDWSSLSSLRWSAHPHLLAAHFGFLSALFGLLVVGWKHAVESCGFSMSPATAASTWLVPNLGKYVPGKVFMFAGRIGLAHRAGMRRAVALTAMTYEHLMMIFATYPFMVVSALDKIDQYNVAAVGLIIGIGVAALVVLMYPRALRALLDLALRKMNRQPLTSTPCSRDSWKLLSIYTSSFVCYGASGAYLARAFGIGADLPPSVIGAAFVSAWVIGFVSMLTPGGLGVREAALVLLLAPEVSRGDAVALALAGRLTWTVMEIGGVLAGLVISNSIVRQSEEDSED